MWRTLGSVGTWQAGGTPSRANSSYYGGNIPWLKTGDLNDGYITDIPERITEIGLNNSSAKWNPEGSVLIAMYGATIGKVGILTFPATTNQACCACFNFVGVSNKYLFYFLMSQKEEFVRKAGGGAQPNISKDIIVSTLFPMPPLQEQVRITAEIERWFAVVDKLDNELSNLQSDIEKAKSSILTLAISGKLVPQDPTEEPAIDLLRRINPDFVPCDNSHYPFELPNGWVISIFGVLNEHKSKSVNPMLEPEKKYELYSVPTFETGKPEFMRGGKIGSTKQAVSIGEVLVCKINPHLNRVWKVEHYDHELTCIASSEWIVFSSQALVPEFAVLFFQSQYFRDLMMSNVSGVGGSLMRARPSAVDGYPIPIPPIREQKRIVSMVLTLVDKITCLISAI